MEADSSYVRKSADTLLEVAVKLSQILWRKTLPSQIADADKSLVDVTYDLLERKRYVLAIILLDFAFEVIKKYSCPDIRLRLLINRANAYRLIGNRTRCAELIDGEDWEAYDPSFRLAAHVLKDEKDEALKCMKQIGVAGKISKMDYRVWPIFEGIRTDQDFMNTFAEIFKEPFLKEEIITSQDSQDASAKAFANFSLDDISNADFSFATQAAKPN